MFFQWTIVKNFRVCQSCLTDSILQTRRCDTNVEISDHLIAATDIDFFDKMFFSYPSKQLLYSTYDCIEEKVGLFCDAQ